MFLTALLLLGALDASSCKLQLGRLNLDSSAQKQDIVKNFYEQFAGVYDAAAQELKWKSPEAVGNAIRKNISIRNGKALGLGIGTGLEIEPLVERDFEISAVDLSANMLSSLKIKFPSARIQTLHGDMTSILSSPSFKPSSFDIVESSGALEFVPQFERTLELATRLLKPNGLLIFTFRPTLGTENIFEVEWGGVGVRDFGSFLWNPKEIETMLSHRLGMKVISNEFHPAFVKRKFQNPTQFKEADKSTEEQIYYGVIVAQKIAANE